MGLLNLPAIESSLRRVQREFESINRRLSWQRDPMSDTVVENLLAGYTYVDILIDWGIDVFSMGKHKYLLELNNIVLCGPDQTLRAEFAQHLKATEKRFYDEPEGGIEDVVEWRARHLHESVWKLAAGLYVRALGKPQLFIEGNHRTGALLASYILMQAGQPPFVLTVENAVAYFDPSTVIRDTRKLGPMALFRLPGINKRFARFLEDHADTGYLLAPDAPAAHGTRSVCQPPITGLFPVQPNPES
jgi:prophage maintenance system killer protein